MLLRLPPSLHYPITVTSLLKQPGDAVERDEALFWYVYQTTVTEGDGLGNKIEVQRKFPTKFESTVDGEIVQWKIAKGDVIQRPYVDSYCLSLCLASCSFMSILCDADLAVVLMWWKLTNHALMRFSLEDSAPNAAKT